MRKLSEIINAEQKRVFDLIRESDDLYLYVKCSDSKKHSKIVKIKVLDVFCQVWQKMSLLEKRKTYQCFMELTETDSKTA